ncbi:hypothetical protein TRVL_08788 [Trypanosoma vivax]|nr:hypothetical protein TRVL_08788 [Trypanosoma vivax]
MDGVSCIRPARVRECKWSRSPERWKARIARRMRRPGNNKRLCRVKRNAFAAGEWGATVQRVTLRWLVGLIGSQGARGGPGNNELRGRYRIGFRHRRKTKAPRSSRSHCTVRGQEKDN